MHAVMYKEDLPAAIDFAQNGLANQVLVKFADSRANGQAFLRRRLDHAHVAHVDQRHVQRARDRRGRHGQHVYLVAQLLEPFLVCDAKTLLLVHHQQAQIEKDDILSQQAMRADHNIDPAQRQVFQYLLLLFLRTEAAQQLDAYRIRLEAFLERVEVLQRQYRCRHQHGHLALIEDRLERGAQGHLCFTVAYVSAHQPVHGPGPFHVGLHFLDSVSLVGRLLVREAAFQFLEPGLFGVGRVCRAFHRLARAVQAQQVARDLLHALLHLRFRARPLAVPQFAEGGYGVAHAHVARDTIELIRRNVQLVRASVTNEQVFALHARRIQLHQPLESANAVFLMHDIVPDVDLGQERGGSDDFTLLRLVLARPAENLGIGEQRGCQAARLPALRQLSLDQHEGAAFRCFVDIDAGADMNSRVAQDSLVAQHFGQTPRLRADNHHPFAVTQGLAAILHEGAQSPAVRVRAGEGWQEMIGAA